MNKRASCIPIRSYSIVYFEAITLPDDLALGLCLKLSTCRAEEHDDWALGHPSGFGQKTGSTD